MPGVYGSADGTGSTARFDNPVAVAVDSADNVYVADVDNYTVRKITPAGQVTTLAGLAGNPGSADGSGSAARFSAPAGIAVNAAGDVFVADMGNHTIRKIDPGAQVTTLAGLAGSPGSADGTGTAARFNYPNGLAVDNAGNIYVADTYNHTIRKITPGRIVTTLAGLAGSAGSADGTGNSARFNLPWGVGVDISGNVYVADTANNTIRKITPLREVTTLAGWAGHRGYTDGTTNLARFYFPFAVVADAEGNLFVADGGNEVIQMVSAGGKVMTVAGWAGSSGSADGTGGGATFNGPMGVSADGAGRVYVADTYNHTIRKGVLACPDQPVIDFIAGPVGSARQLDTAPQTAVSWSWRLLQRPSGSTVALSSATVRNPVFTPDFIGDYLLELWTTNALGHVRAGRLTFRADVPTAGAPPVMTILPASLAVRAGANVIMTAAAQGSWPLYYQWRANGVSLLQATNGVLPLNNISANQAGQYSVVVSNPYGSVTSTPPALLRVLSSNAFCCSSDLVLGSNLSAHPYAAVYEFDDLVLGDNVQVTSEGISHLVVKVRGALVLGMDAAIRVRNGYYLDAPTTPLSSVNSNNLSTLGTNMGGVRVYPGIFGRGGNGGAGSDFVHVGSCQPGGIPWYNTAVYYGASGGGGAGFGGGSGGPAGISISIYPDPALPGSQCSGGAGGSGICENTWYSRLLETKAGGPGGLCGGGVSVGRDGVVGTNGYDTHCGYWFGGGGGGGGGDGGSGGYDGIRPPGGGGGGYGGGILTIIANEIVYDPAYPPHFLVSGQKGGAPNGQNGEGGMLIVQAGTYAASPSHWQLGANAYGAHASGLTNGGHGVVSGNPQKVFMLPPTAPAITIQPQSQTVGVGANAVFSVVATGTPPLTYRWWFNETNIIDWATNAVLMLTNVQLADAGQYTVVVSNSVGSVTNAPAVLVVGTVWLDPPSPQPDGKFVLTVHSPAGTVCEVWASTDLPSWTLVRTLTNETGMVSFTDPEIKLPRRFYRAQLP